MKRTLAPTFAALAFLASSFTMAGVTISNFGTTSNGKEVDLYTLTNVKGMTLKVMNYGATVVGLEVPGKTEMVDVALGFKDFTPYETKSPYFGAIVGRYGNRIAHGKFTLNGKTYHLALNNVNNGISTSLHGGKVGFDKRIWTATPGGTKDEPAVVFNYVSPDGEEGYPGTLSVTVIYRLLRNNTMRIEYTASTTKATPINITNHTYFNLNGEGNGTVLNTLMQLNCSHFTPTDAGLIPTGRLQPVAHTPFDFRKPTPIGKHIGAHNQQLKWAGGYDQNFVIDHNGVKFAQAAKVYSKQSGIQMEVYTDQPGIQFYTGNFLDGTLIGKSGNAYVHRGAFCLETQHFPDSPNHKNFPTTILQPSGKHGHPYHSVTEYRFSIK